MILISLKTQGDMVMLIGAEEWRGTTSKCDHYNNINNQREVFIISSKDVILVWPNLELLRW
jgi:hypothetical protein